MTGGAQQQLSIARSALAGEAWGKVRRLLTDPRALNHLDWLHAPLAQAVLEPM
jgi:hypothetical protein